jgi:hypothetical protein
MAYIAMNEWRSKNTDQSMKKFWLNAEVTSGR